jgi:(1->4)-alpha-D-glucan 1-alpha-D-glucosylmutase
VATRLPIGLVREGGWGDTSVIVAGRPMTEVFTGQHFDGGTLRLSQLLGRYPVALLIPSE